MRKVFAVLFLVAALLAATTPASAQTLGRTRTIQKTSRGVQPVRQSGRNFVRDVPKISRGTHGPSIRSIDRGTKEVFVRREVPRPSLSLNVHVERRHDYVRSCGPRFCRPVYYSPAIWEPPYVEPVLVSRPAVVVVEQPPPIVVGRVVARASVGDFQVGDYVGGSSNFKFVGPDGRLYEADVDHSTGVIEGIELD